MTIFKKRLIVIFTIMLTTALAESSKYDGYEPVMLCKESPGLFMASGVVCLYPSVKETSTKYVFDRVLGYTYTHHDGTRDKYNWVDQEEAEKYGFKVYPEILKMLNELEQNENKRSWREKIDNPLNMVKLPEKHRDDFFDFLAKFDPKVFAELQQIKDTANKNIEVVNNILNTLKNIKLAQSLVIGELNTSISELQLNADKQKNIAELILVTIQKDIARLLIDNYKGIFYVAKAKYNNNDPTYNALKNIIKFATKIENKLHISMNEALEIAVGLNDGVTFTDIKFPGKIKRKLVIEKLKAIAKKYNYNENIDSIILHLEIILKRNLAQSTDNQYKKLIEITIRNFEKAKLAQEASINNLQEANKIKKLKELLQELSPNNFNEDAKIMVEFTENYFKPLVRSYKFEIYFRNGFQNETISNAYLKRYAKIRSGILLEYIKNHDIIDLDDLVEAYNYTKEDFIKQIQKFDWKEVGKFPLEDKIKELHLSRNIVKKLDREIESLKFFDSDPERKLEKINFKYKGLFTFIDKWFDQYYNEY